MTEEEMIKESQNVISNWTDSLLWYMQEYRDLGYEKIANIFIKNFALHARQMAQELRKADMEEKLIIHNKPDCADDYEFVVARKCNDEYWFWGAYKDGFKADKVASEVDGVIFHNVRIQGKRR